MVYLLTVNDIGGNHGLGVTTMVLAIEADEGVNVREAIKDACKEYCQTEEGKATYEGNCCSFNWGDFEAYVPNTICEKYGIKKIDSYTQEEDIDFNEQLVNEKDIFPEEEE
jgi:hypothetical protein